MDISPGLIGLYWLAASFAATALWVAACEIARWLHQSIDRAATLPAQDAR